MLSILLLWSSFCHAQKLEKYLPQGCYHTGQYKQIKTLKDVKKPLITEGSFAFDCNQGLIWHTHLPIVETAIYKIEGDHSLLREDATLQKLDNRVHRTLGKLLNNLIGGNEDYLQQNFSITEQDDAAVLAPKNKQMKKFLQALIISKSENLINIHLDVVEQDDFDIQIFSQQKLTSLDHSQCEHLPRVPLAACKILYDGTRQ